MEKDPQRRNHDDEDIQPIVLVAPVSITSTIRIGANRRLMSPRTCKRRIFWGLLLLLCHVPLSHSFSPSRRAVMARRGRSLPPQLESSSVLLPRSNKGSFFLLREKKGTDQEIKEGGADMRRRTTGMDVGPWLFGVFLVLRIWTFTLPPEFRQARFCSEEEVRLYPESQCTTFSAWTAGIQDYYQQGGGIAFDVSMDRDS